MQKPGNSLVSPKMLCVTAVMKGPSWHQTGTVCHLLSNLKIIAQYTGLLLRTGHNHGKHVVRKHLHWQSRDELTQLFPPSLILDGISWLTEKNVLAKNGDNSAWGEKNKKQLPKTLKYHLIIRFTHCFPPMKMLGMKTCHPEPFTHQQFLPHS